MAKVECTCLQCGVKFLAKQCEILRGRKYCSVECRNAGYIKLVECKCLYCNNVFQETPSAIKRGAAKYCSVRCRGLAKQQRVNATCLQCGGQFETYQSKINRGVAKYCCFHCANAARKTRIDCQCLQCGKSFWIVPSSIKNGEGKYCSYKCYGLSKTGALSTKWKGGKYKSFGLNWKPQRDLAYKRDNGTCQHCGLTESASLKKYKCKCSVHHIEKRRAFRERGESVENANNLTNLITLCKSCHPKAELGKIILQPKLL